jgi:signal transduction histidine kinase
MNAIKRHRYLVSKPVQYTFIGMVVVPLVLLLAALYYLIYYSVFSQMLIPEAVAVTLLPAMKSVNIVVLIALPVLLFILLRAALIYSNRIIGPIPRLERELDRALAGDYSVRIKARDKDELRNFISKINSLLEKLDSGRNTA